MNDRHMQGQHEPMVEPIQAYQAQLRHWLQPEATRLATAVWWPTMTATVAQRLLEVNLRCFMLRSKGGNLFDQPLPPEWASFAASVMQEALDDIGAAHAATIATIGQVATDALRAGAGRAAVASAALSVARSALPLPPPWMVQEAIEKAAREYRFETKFWQRRERVS